jgi:hypothetical protein|tara:strand:- start:392 stop:877 length:486 start_codon:yes stop_codon:yes gene_type:complete
MNIFYTNHDPILAARDLPDKLVVKMPLESAQMLSTAQRFYNGDKYCDKNGIYKTAYLNHPCTVWTRESSANYLWLYLHFCGLCSEYTYRYGKVHESFRKLVEVIYKLPNGIPDTDMTPVRQAMPDQYKDPDPTVAYRNYLINEKHYAAWNKTRPRPNWWLS